MSLFGGILRMGLGMVSVQLARMEAVGYQGGDNIDGMTSGERVQVTL